MTMTMQRHDYPNIGETLYSAELPNGLRLRVVPKKGFATFYAAFAANYGGADRRFELDGEAIDIFLSTRCSTCRTATAR